MSSEGSDHTPKEKSKKTASKLQTECKVEHANSLQCILDNYTTKDVACAPFFEAYKECRKMEHAAILEANKGRFGWW